MRNLFLRKSREDGNMDNKNYRPIFLRNIHIKITTVSNMNRENSVKSETVILTHTGLDLFWKLRLENSHNRLTEKYFRITLFCTYKIVQNIKNS